MIKINEVLVEEIKRYGEREYPYECCGILFGKLGTNGEKTVQEILSISNSREEKDRHNRFLITPFEMMKAESYGMKKGLDIVGFYHSHPDHPAIPSGYDLEHAWPVYSYIIISVEKGNRKDFTSWELEEDRTKFNSEIIIIK